MLDSGEPLWSPMLASGRIANDVLRQVESEYGVVIIRNKSKRQLLFYGPEQKYGSVQQTLRRSLKAQTETTYHIPLDDRQFAWACNGGFRRITSTLGPEVASLDIVSRPRCITVAGSYKQYQSALDITHGKTPEQNLAQDDSNDDCSICWTEPEEPIMTSCGHVYCAECFEGLCTSAASSGKEFSICCQGEGGKCDKKLPLQVLQEDLSSTAFEDLLEASFRSFIARHPQDFRYCSTPDCGYVYRATSTASKHTCPKCLAVLCTGCHQQHGFMTCSEYKDLTSGGYEASKIYKEEMGVKDCPKCTTPMEKTEGCNHMHCGGCGAHVCWVCLQYFESSGQCYAHTTAQHGGCFSD